MNSDVRDNLDRLVRERREQTKTPGVALAVVQGDHVIYAEGFGTTSVDPEQAVAVTPRTVFRIGSTTKPLTGTLLMRLVEAGKLTLEEPIVTYLPWFRLSDPEATRRVTLRHLMSHQSGLPWGSQFFGTRDPDGLEAYVREQVPRFPLLAPPGVLFRYSNIGVNVAGYVAEVVGGAPFAELMQTWVFQPLGMERTFFDPLRAMAIPPAQAHDKTEEGVAVRRAEAWAENVAYRPSAMAFSTVSDMAKVARLYLNRGMFGGVRLLPEESVAEMHRTQVDEYQADGRTVGLNFALTRYRGQRRVGHPGGIASFGSYFSLLPNVGVGVLLQFNSNAFWQAGEEIIRQVFDAVLEHAPQGNAVLVAPATAPYPPRPDLWPRCVGTFLGAGVGLVEILVSPKGKNLMRARWGKPGVVLLTPLRHDLYTGRNADTGETETVGFIGLGEASGTHSVTYLMWNGAPCVRVERDLLFVADPAAWGEYSGVFQGPDETASTGLDVLRVESANGTLTVSSDNRARSEEAIPWDKDGFIYRERFLRFQRNASGGVASLTLGEARTRYERIGL